MVNKREFPRNMSFVNRQGNVVHPNREEFHAKKSAKVGKAYGLFDCNATKEKIEDKIPFIRDSVNTPNQLELSLMESDNLPAEIQLRHAVTGTKYTIETTYPNATNKQTADELSAVLNQAYQSSLYQKGEKFRGVIIYEENGEYLFR